VSKLNVDLMLAVRDQVTMHPETHDQFMWARKTECGTTYCIAGWAAVLSGQQLLWELAGEAGDEEAGWIRIIGPRGPTAGRSISTFARDELGLTPYEAGELFASDLSEDEALAKLDALIEKGKNQP